MNDSALDMLQIRDECRRLIGEIIGADVSSLDEDVPLAQCVTSSLHLVEISRQIYDRFGVLIPMRRVLEEEPTLRVLAVLIDEELRSSKNGDDAAEDGTANEAGGVDVPLAASQSQVAFLARYSPGGSAGYNESVIVRLEGPLDQGALERAVVSAADTYEAARTSLASDTDGLRIGRRCRLRLTASECTADHLRQRLAGIVTRPFDVGEDLFCARLVRISATYHVLVLVSHALVVDRPGLELIVQHAASVYSQVSEADASKVHDRPLQWTEYLALAQAPWAQKEREVARAWWTELLAKGTPRLELPTDSPRPAVKTYQADRLTVPVDPQLAESLAAWSQARGVSPYVVVLAGFATMLHRVSSAPELLIGAHEDVAAERKPAVAPTVRVLPIWSRYDSKQSFEDYVGACAKAFAESRQRSALSLAELIGALKLPRDQSQSPLFTVACRSQTIGHVPMFEGLRAEFVDAPGSAARYDIDLILTSGGGDGWRLHCDYAKELFAPATIARWLDGVLMVIQAGVADAKLLCGRLPVLSEADKRTVLGWNATKKAYPGGSALDAIVEQARLRPDQVAVRFQEQSISYRELLARADDFGALLRAAGVGHGDRVGVFLPRSPDVVATLLAAWRVGAAYVPIDTTFPQHRIASVVEDAAFKVVVTSRDLRAKLEGDVTVVCIDEAGHGGPIDATPASASDVAYIMYTSGSTGRPKGVPLSHGGLVNCLLAVRDYLKFEPGHTFFAATTIAFDISLTELVMPLVAGGTVDIGDEGIAGDGIRLAECLEKRSPSHVQLTPSGWRLVLSAEWGGDKGLTAISTGEAIRRDLAEDLLRRCGALWNFYGPTETTIYSTAYRVESAPGERMRIGRALPNTDAWVLDENLEIVPIGGVGELYLGGDGLAREYWNRPELTRERFIPHPFAEGKRLYRTGDLARYGETGDLVWLGRSDQQIKIHGVRVEPAEVEAALREVPGVRDAAVVSSMDPHGDAQLVAHVIVDNNAGLTAARIRAALRETLPLSMVPSYVVFTDAFPRSPNGKLQRSLLPAPALDGGGERSGDVVAGEAPETQTERSLAELWSELLPGARIHRDDDFIDLGGHSLLVTRLMLEVRKRFHVTFVLRDFFGASTLRGFASLVDRLREAKNDGRRANEGTRRTKESGLQRMAFLRRDAMLPSSIVAPRGAPYAPPPGGPRAVLLTGATGFIGTYFVDQLLRTSDVSVYCLVRSRKGTNPKARLADQLRSYELSNNWDDRVREAWDKRVHVVEGDVTLPRFGLNVRAYHALADTVDSIIHSAALVNFIYPYEALRAVNVLGVHEIVRFAFFGRIKPVHYISTAAIWPMGAERTHYERDSIDHEGPLNIGYDEAKWVGERVLLNAADRGLPVARYRPGEVGGDSRTGRCVTEHFVIAAVKGFLQINAVPDLDMYLDLTPADYVAQAVVELVLRRNPIGRAFHLTNPRRMHMRDVYAYLRGLGYRFEIMPFERVRERLVNSPDFARNALFPFYAILEEMDDVSLQLPNYDCSDTTAEIRGSGIECPAVDGQLLGRYMSYLRGIGYMPEP